MPTFAFNSRYVLLTYSQCGDLDPFLVCSHVGDLGGECIIGRESHQDSGTHLHAFVDFGRKFRSRRANVFDVGGFHPNVSPSRGNPQGGFDYATKDGDIVAGGLERPPDGTTAGNEDNGIWGEAMEATSRDDFFALLERYAPKDLILHYPAISRFADWRYAREPEDYVGPDGTFDTSQYPELQRWVETSLGERVAGT